MTTWLKDDNGNKCSVEYWGSEEAAQKALDSLKNCKGCSDCRCSRCSAASSPQALDMGTWHTCEKTHCRAGWIITLAGAAGRALEDFYDTPLAAMKIYDASSALPKISPVRFFEPDDLALADMKRMAELEAAGGKVES